MAAQVSATELRHSLTELIRWKEDQVKEVHERHDASLRALYDLLARPRAAGSDFPDVAAEQEADYGVTYDTWKEEYALEAGFVGRLQGRDALIVYRSKRIAKLDLPIPPPVSPPPGVTVFPDEQPDAPIEPEAGPSRPSSPSSLKRLRSLHPSPSTTTIALVDVQPRRERMAASPLLRGPIPDWVPQDNYNPASGSSPSPPPVLLPLETDYAARLPRLPPLPSPNPAKRRRLRSNEREVKPDLFRLQAEYGLNPISDSLARSAKCVLTMDWKVAQAELRHMRAMEKVEAKKKEGRWSLRQPKKLRGPPIPKSHWDYLLEEMEWMQVDFAEERRWKRVLAREFAFQVVEWHLASETERRDLMGGRKWGGVRPLSDLTEGEGLEDAEDDVEMLVDAADGEAEEEEGTRPGQRSQEVLDEILPRARQGRTRRRRGRSEDEEEGNEAEASDVPQVKEEADDDAVMDAEEDANADTDAEGEEDADGELDAEGEEDAEGEADDAEGEPDADGEAEDDIGENIVGLDAIPDVVEDDGEVAATADDLQTLPNGITISKYFASAQEVLAARKPVLELPLERSIVDLDLVPQLAIEVDIESPVPPPSMQDLFPELVVYTGPAAPDTDSIQHRPVEGNVPDTRLAHTSRILDLQPIFVSSIQPAKNAVSNSTWELHDGLWWEDPQNSAVLGPEVVGASSSVFHGRGVDKHKAKSALPPPKPNSQQPKSPHVWTDEEDELLHRLIKTYPYNWRLISDTFNSEYCNISPDQPTPYECYDRWYWKWGEGKGKVKPEEPDANAVASPAPATAQPGTAANSAAPTIVVPTLPGQQAAAQDGADGQPPPPPGLSRREQRHAGKKYEGSRKAIHHQVMFDAVRRSSRRRDAAKLKGSVKDLPRRTISVHESHAQYQGGTVRTADELLEIKVQRDAQAKQVRAAQQTEARNQQLRQQALIAAQQQQLRAQQAANGQPAGPGTPGQAVPGQAGQGQPQVRLGPNGQPLPNIAPTQQQLLNVVAAASAVAVRQQAANGVQQAQGTPNSVNRQQPNAGAVPANGMMGTTQMNQQMQMLHAQQLAARQNLANMQQAQAQAQARGMPVNASPYSQQGAELPNGDGQHGSPALGVPGALPHNSPQQGTQMGRNPSLAMQPQFRAASGGSPQISNSSPRAPSQGPGPSPQQIPASIMPPNMTQAQQQQINSAAMQQLLQTLQANGQQATPETVRAAAYLRNQQLMQAQALAQAQAHATGQAQAQAQAQTGDK